MRRPLTSSPGPLVAATAPPHRPAPPHGSLAGALFLLSGATLFGVTYVLFAGASQGQSACRRPAAAPGGQPLRS